MADDKREDLIEQQGVNAGPPVDDPVDPSPELDSMPEPPDRPAAPGTAHDEQVGLPGQKPGYPGQQRSVETS